MLFLILAIICSGGMGIVMRYAEEHYSNMKMVTLMNYICAIICCYVFMENKKIIPDNGEQPGRWQWVGVVIAIVAIITINYEKNSSHELGFKAGLILLFAAGGGADMMSKVFEHLGNHAYSSLFLLYTFGVAFVLCLAWTVKNRAFAIAGKEIGFGIALGIFNYVSTMLLLQALLVMRAFIAYPVYSVGVIVFINVANFLLMKEPISKRQLLGMGIISAALMFLNM